MQEEFELCIKGRDKYIAEGYNIEEACNTTYILKQISEAYNILKACNSPYMLQKQQQLQLLMQELVLSYATDI